MEEQFFQNTEAPVFSDPSTLNDLEVILSDLPKKTREILKLFKIEGLSVAEVAAATQISEPAIRVTIHRAIKKLQNTLKVRA